MNEFLKVMNQGRMMFLMVPVIFQTKKKKKIEDELWILKFIRSPKLNHIGFWALQISEKYLRETLNFPDTG